ncbi:hypothetical protein IC006_1997 [Sulfuracidifex tepidarius]|uniref:MobA-like NTP transferase domain-containing protein n=2 Tax=Sulfuracidifex tepidarius TaxID=1294262 RepID=A0A510E4I9_9CREN|nr:hypothetical protein IC006_1997 [Sulfuracidifex tepidarius]BBG27452.1 hypothetical protein IC007_2005 [Sulfuracidifex tepidarius]
MAGGKGKRLSMIKPLLTVCGVPILKLIVDSLSPHIEVWIATTNGHPVERFVRNYLGMENFLIFTRGLGYEIDVIQVVETLGFPLITVPADSPFLTWRDIEHLIEECRSSLCSLKDNKGFTGISFWRDHGYSKYFQDVSIDHEILNVNDWNAFLQANKNC